MAMKRGVKIGLSILVIGLTATAGFLLWKRWKKKKAEKDLGNFGTQNVSTEEKITRIQEINTTTNPPTSQEINSSPIPFTNTNEGNAFRGWINTNYPDYAKEIDLDPTGSYNNSYIKKAWAKYGGVYTLSSAGTAIKDKVVGNIKKLITAVGTSATGTGWINTSKGTTPPNVSVGFDATAVANAVIQSMKGAGTNEKLFFDTMNQLDVSQKTQVKAKVLELSGSTLESWVQGDFCGWLDTRTSAGKKMCEDAKAVIQTPITNGASST